MIEAVRIDVRLGDIKAGAKYRKHFYGCSDPFQCPIANAARRVFKQEVMVTGEAIYLYGKGDYSVYNLPSEAMAWIEAFGNGEKVAPFEFVVTPQQ